MTTRGLGAAGPLPATPRPGIFEEPGNASSLFSKLSNPREQDLLWVDPGQNGVLWRTEMAVEDFGSSRNHEQWRFYVFG